MTSILKFLNIRAKGDMRILYIAIFISTLAYGYSNPRIIKEIVSSLPSQYLSVESLTICLSNILIGVMWKGKARDVIIRNFAILATLETIASVILGIWLLFVDYNVWVLAIASLVYINGVSLFVNKCIMTFKSKLFICKDREDFDNGSATISAMASVIGFSISALLMPSLEVGIAFWSMACIFDDIGWITVYLKNRRIVCSD